jgi:hypothetical protein
MGGAAELHSQGGPRWSPAVQFEMRNWNAIAAPAASPKPVIKRSWKPR